MSVSGPKRTFALCCRISARSEADNGGVRATPACKTCVANRASMRFCRSAETRLARGRLPITVRGDPLELFDEEEPMKANAIKANAIPPQPDETFFPSARTKAVPSDDLTKKACDRQRIVATLREKFNGKPIAYTANHKNLTSYVDYNPPKRNAIVNGVGILRRVFAALLKAMDESRQRQVEREIAKYVALRGGRITDDLEREITRRLFTSDWRSPRE